MKRIYKVDFEAKYVDTYPGTTKQPHTSRDNDSMTVICGPDAEKAIAIVRKRKVGKISHGSYDEVGTGKVRFTTKCVSITIDSVTIKAEAEA